MNEEQQQPEPEATHTRANVKKQLFITLLIAVFIITGTIGVIMYAKGYRFLFQKGEPQVTKTGILNITSDPVGAQIYIDDHPTVATNNSLNLTPGKYKVKVAKDGYTDWQKDFEIKKEEVSSADVRLFPKAPTLQSISTLGIESVVVDPSGTKLAFNIASQSANKKNGIYVVDMTSRSFPVLIGQSSSTQIADDTNGPLFSKAAISWSPDGKQILAAIETTPDIHSYYLLQSDRLNDAPQDVTATLQVLKDTWAEQRKEKEIALSKSLKPNVQKFANKNFNILAWSPDESKILYQASSSGQMPIFVTPRRIGNNGLYERRDLTENAVYVYSIKEDVNTRVADSIDKLCQPGTLDCKIPFTWFPDSGHIVFIHDKKIDIIEDDGANITTLYAGPFIDHYVFPWPDGSKLVILTNLSNTAVPPTLYTIGLK
jgi:Tol biopolymer transport system component